MDVTAVAELRAVAQSTAAMPPAPAQPPARHTPTGGGAAASPSQNRLLVTLDIDENIGRVVTIIVNPETGEEVNQIPAAQMRKIAAAIREMLGSLVDASV